MTFLCPPAPPSHTPLPKVSVWPINQPPPFLRKPRSFSTSGRHPWCVFRHSAAGPVPCCCTLIPRREIHFLFGESRSRGLIKARHNTREQAWFGFSPTHFFLWNTEFPHSSFPSEPFFTMFSLFFHPRRAWEGTVLWLVFPIWGGLPFCHELVVLGKRCWTFLLVFLVLADVQSPDRAVSGPRAILTSGLN